MNPTEIKRALKHCEFFERLEKSDISEIAGLCQVNTYEGGEYVFQQGDYGEYIYVAVQGRVHLVRYVDLGAAREKRLFQIDITISLIEAFIRLPSHLKVLQSGSLQYQLRFQSRPVLEERHRNRHFQHAMVFRKAR